MSQPSQDTTSQTPAAERNPEEQATETTPLLNNEEHAPSSEARATDPERSEEALVTPDRLQSARQMQRLTTSSLSLAVAAFVFSIGSQILRFVAHLPVYWGPGEEAIYGIAVTAAISLIISAVNLKQLRQNGSQLPRFLNLIFDLGLSFYALAWGMVYLANITYPWCYGSRQNCSAMKIAIKAVGGVSAAAAVALGAIHFTLLVIRIRAAYRSRFWREPWNFPNGQLKFEFSVKFLRYPEGSAAVSSS